MADLQVMSKFVIIFTFMAFGAILTSEGRTIKSARDNELRAVNNDQMHEQGSQFLNPSQSPTYDDHSDAGKETIPSPTAHDQAVDLGESEAVDRDDFRPTTPGSSPRVGHSFVGLKKELVPPKAPSGNEERLTALGTLDDFEGTRPGHSPGVGHDFQNGEPKA
ncbi:hypothetical protein ACJRO7_030934 [Eucalyptus globulus]|uniref:Uncharacterized protein n=1 Tax=Eucalyptus globulus TaxID=34317 RepID=A0ABD3JFJ2_EUCGL